MMQSIGSGTGKFEVDDAGKVAEDGEGFLIGGDEV
jgi:hypothetical protein